MARISRNQRYILIGGAGLLILALLYRYYKGQSGGSGGSPTTADPNGEVGAIGSQLAGQEQGDVAGLQNSIGNLQSQEQGDIGAIAAQEAQDVGGLQATLNALAGDLGTVSSQVAAIATGQTPAPRNTDVTVRRGSGFDRYYLAITGRHAPARIAATNFLLQAWRSHLPAANVKALMRHPAAHSPSHAANRHSTHETKPRQHVKPGTHPASNRPTSKTTGGAHPQTQTKAKPKPKPRPRKRGH